MAISTNGAIIARFVGGLYNTVLSNATYLELVSQDPSTLANKLYAADFGKKTDLEVGTAIVANLGLSALTGLDAWVAAQLTAAGAANKGAKIASMLNDFSAMTADTTYGTYATAFNTKVDAALAASQKTGNAEAKFETAGVTATVTSFTLTTGVDAIVGSAGDDTITAPATVAATGLGQTTINAGDTIDGGLGNDTLTMTFGSAFNTADLATVKGVENIVYVGVNNLASGNADYVAAVAAKAVTATALTAAVAAKVNAVTANTDAIAALAAATAMGTKTAAEIKALAVTGVAGTGYSIAQAKTAAGNALKSSTGTTLDDAGILLRAGVLVTDATNAKSATDTLVAASPAVGSVYTAEVAAYLADVTAAAKVAATKSVLGSVSIAANTEATSITIDGTAATITGLTDTQKVTIKAASVTNALSYAPAATVTNLALSSGSGTVTFKDGATADTYTKVATANVTGTVKAAVAATATSNATAGTVTLVDSTGAAQAGAIKALTLGLTSDAKVSTVGMAKLTSIDGSTSTGGLDFSAGTVPSSAINVKTGAGKDTITFTALTSATSTTTATASLDTGAGDDTIINSTTGDGTVTISAGAGDDTITTALGSGTVDGGDGKDTVLIANTSFSTGNYNNVKASFTNVETLGLNAATAVTINASKVAQFTGITFANTGTASANLALANSATEVADTQAVTLKGTDATVAAAGYTAKSYDTVAGDTVTATAYAGALTINASGGSANTDATTQVNVTAKASSVTLNVAAAKSGLTNTSSFVTLTGDVKTATINIANTVDNTKTAGADVANTVSLTVASTLAASAGGVANGGPASALGNLSAVTVVGSGNVIINNANGGVATKLKTVDASALGGAYTIAVLDTAGAITTKVGTPLGGLTYTANALVSETISLGAGKDAITAASTYAKMDSITGFTLVGKADGTLDTTKSDDLTVVDTSQAFIKATAGYSTTSLDAALATLANRTTTGTDKVVFQTGGNTYIFIDAVNGNAATPVVQNGVEDGDTVVELVGLVDLDLLLLALNS